LFTSHTVRDVRSRAICANLRRAVLVNPKLSLAQSEKSHEYSASVSVRLLLHFNVIVVHSDVVTAGDAVICLGRHPLAHRY
jgi:hypothetical protein